MKNSFSASMDRDVELNFLTIKEDSLRPGSIYLDDTGGRRLRGSRSALSSSGARRASFGFGSGTMQTPGSLSRWVDSFRRDPGQRVTPETVVSAHVGSISAASGRGSAIGGGGGMGGGPGNYPMHPLQEAHPGSGHFYDLHSANYATAHSSLARELKGRHLQMIAIGGSIGTGLFVASGNALAVGGPASVLLAYCFIGIMLYCTVHALGELAVAFPIAGSFSAFSTRFLDPSWGFSMGWNYALQWLVVLPLEVIAASRTVTYWNTSINKGVFVTIFLFTIMAINLCGVKIYGEAEFIFAIVKVATIIGFILLGIVINIGGTPTEGYIGGKFWHNPGAFHNGFKGLCSVFVTAAFAFAGTELVGLAAAETRNPRKSLPTAIKQVFWRITLFYVVALTLVGLLVPYDEDRLFSNAGHSDTFASPFVIAIESAGIQVLPSVMNSVILVAIISVGNSAVFGASRTLAALADLGQAPRILSYVDRRGRPLVAILVCFLVGFLSYLADVKAEADVLAWLVAISGLSSIFTWGSICLSHIRFRKAWLSRGRSLDELAFRAQSGVLGSWLGLILNILVLVAQFWVGIWQVGWRQNTTAANVENFFLQFLAAPIVFIMWIGHKLYYGTSYVRIDDMDIDTGRRDFNLPVLVAKEQEEKMYWPRWKKLYKFFC